jgi:hypothetical protein
VRPALGRDESRDDPPGDAPRRPVRIPLVTILIILVNVFVFVRELNPSDRIRTILLILLFVKITFTARLIGFWFLAQLFDAGPGAHAQTSGVS